MPLPNIKLPNPIIWQAGKSEHMIVTGQIFVERILGILTLKKTQMSGSGPCLNGFVGSCPVKPCKILDFSDVGRFRKDAQRQIMQNGIVCVSVALTATLFVAKQVFVF